jgi:hypothetical protein
MDLVRPSRRFGIVSPQFGPSIGSRMTRRLLKNLRILSTSAPARSCRVERSVFRRRTCDRRIWTKPLALAADAGFAMGFQSIFAREALPGAGFAKRAVIEADRRFHESFA